MPTGYTSYILDGADFKTYALVCARAFGALILERDNPLTPEIPDSVEPDDYHTKRLFELREELASLFLMPDDAKEQKAKEVYEAAKLHSEQGIKDALEKKNKYEVVLAQAKLYQPPTSEHTGIKEFMIKQIEDSIKWDCSTEYYEKLPVLQTGKEWYDSRLTQIQKDIHYHTEKYDEEVKRCKERTDWIQQYKKSLS